VVAAALAAPDGFLYLLTDHPQGGCCACGHRAEPTHSPIAFITPMKISVPEKRSRMAKRNGRSTRIS
jgi:hypothetical protein